MNLNYTGVCYYCGKIYKSCRSTSKYCCKEHNSLYQLNGPQIDNGILNHKGIYRNYSEILYRKYVLLKFDDVMEAVLWVVPDESYYDGPLPLGDKLLLISGFIIKKFSQDESLNGMYLFKPFQFLSKEERANGRILKGTFI